MNDPIPLDAGHIAIHGGMIVVLIPPLPARTATGGANRYPIGDRS